MTMDEYVNKNAVVDKLTALENELQQYKPFRPCEAVMYRKICEVEIEIGKMESTDVAPVMHGKWVMVDDGVMIGDGKHMECSECHIWKIDRIKTDYCPNCGARMDLEVGT